MPADFQPTRWTLVQRSCGNTPEARAALSDLCAACYEPVVAFLRREGRDDDAARELAHSFFAGLLAGGMGNPDQTRGRFRTYLLGALKHFLTKHRHAAMAGKRGGGAEHVPLHAQTDTSPGLQLHAAATTPELDFDREWAFALIARALAALESEHAGRAAQFAALKPWLENGAATTQAETARALGMSETAVKVAIHRLRVRFRELIRAGIAATVSHPDEITDELRHLIEIASRGQDR